MGARKNNAGQMYRRRNDGRARNNTVKTPSKHAKGRSNPSVAERAVWKYTHVPTRIGVVGAYVAKRICNIKRDNKKVYISTKSNVNDTPTTNIDAIMVDSPTKCCSLNANATTWKPNGRRRTPLRQKGLNIQRNVRAGDPCDSVPIVVDTLLEYSNGIHVSPQTVIFKNTTRLGKAGPLFVRGINGKAVATAGSIEGAENTLKSIVMSRKPWMVFPR